MASQMKILIVEDMFTIRILLRGLLAQMFKDRRPPPTFLEASDGSQGLLLARSEKPDLVFSDIEMPNVDGVEFCRRLLGEPRLAATPVVLITSKGSKREEGLRAGARAFISKPVRWDDLEQALRTALPAAF